APQFKACDRVEDREKREHESEADDGEHHWPPALVNCRAGESDDEEEQCEREEDDEGPERAGLPHPWQVEDVAVEAVAVRELLDRSTCDEDDGDEHTAEDRREKGPDEEVTPGDAQRLREREGERHRRHSDGEEVPQRR